MVIFFNVEKVRNFLIKNGYVYTLRKKRFRVGNDTAVYGSRFKQKKIGKVFIEPKSLLSIEPTFKVVVPERLIPFVDESGLATPIPAKVHLLERKQIKLADVKKWFELGQKLSGNDLYLYKVTIKGEAIKE